MEQKEKTRWFLVYYHTEFHDGSSAYGNTTVNLSGDAPTLNSDGIKKIREWVSENCFEGKKIKACLIANLMELEEE